MFDQRWMLTLLPLWQFSSFVFSYLLFGSKKDGAGYLTTFGSSGKRTSFISSDRSGTGMMGLYDKNQKLQWSQKGTKPVDESSDDDSSDPKNNK